MRDPGPWMTTQSILRWAGSKRSSLHALQPFWGARHQRYVEPFAGSCSLFFAICPPAALLSDLNCELMHALSVLRRRPEALHTAVARIKTDKRTYYRVRSLRQNALTSLGRATRFVYLNRHCFNGIYRTSKSGEFNVPYSGSRIGPVPSLEKFRANARALRNATLRCCDFGVVLNEARAGDFVFLDPPYTVDTRRVFREYHPDAFGPTDLDRLEAALDAMHSNGAEFVLTYADCRFSRQLAGRWNARRLRVRRNVAGFVGARRQTTELVVTNIE